MRQKSYMDIIQCIRIHYKSKIVTLYLLDNEKNQENSIKRCNSHEQ